MIDFRTFLCKYWDCSSEELERWEEKTNKLSFANFETLLDAIKKYNEEAIKAALPQILNIVADKSNIGVYLKENNNLFNTRYVIQAGQGSYYEVNKQGIRDLEQEILKQLL